MIERTLQTRWWPAQRLAGLAVLLATLSGAAVALLGHSAWHVYGASAYIVIAVAALSSSAWIAPQVIAGQVMAASLLLGPGRVSPLLVLPLIAAVIATAELLARVGTAGPVRPHDPAGDLRGAGIAAAIGAGAFGAVVLIGSLPGLSGFLAILLGSGACIVLATLLVDAAGSPPEGEDRPVR